MARPRRLHDFGYRGRYSYFLTFCTFARHTAFTQPSAAEMALQQIRRTAVDLAFAISAYCLIPDHAHLLVKGLAQASDLHRFAKLAKQRSGQLYARAAKQPLWQNGYYDHVVRPEESIVHIARYIIENPVRAGLVASAAEYPHVGSDEWSIEEILRAV